MLNETFVQSNGWRMSTCLWVQGGSLPLSAWRVVYFCLYISLTDNEGPSTSSNEFYYTHSSLLYSPDFYRCSLKNCIRDFMIFRAVRVLLSFLRLGNCYTNIKIT